MRKWATGTARAALLTASFVAFGAGGTAIAGTTGANEIALGSNPVDAPVSVPIEASGNSVSVGGNAAGHSNGASASRDEGRRSGQRGPVAGNLVGDQVSAPVSAPVTVCGNAAAVGGNATARCQGGGAPGGSGASRSTGLGPSVGGRPYRCIADMAEGSTALGAPVSAPITVEPGLAALRPIEPISTPPIHGMAAPPIIPAPGTGGVPEIPVTVPLAGPVPASPAGMAATWRRTGGQGGPALTPTTAAGTRVPSTAPRPGPLDTPAGTAKNGVEPVEALPGLPPVPHVRSVPGAPVATAPQVFDAKAQAPETGRLSGLPDGIGSRASAISGLGKAAQDVVGKKQDDTARITPNAVSAVSAGSPTEMSPNAVFGLAIGALLGGGVLVMIVARRIRLTRR